MKQEIISIIANAREEIFKLSDYMYHNPEASYKEVNAYNKIVNILKENAFKVEEHFLDIDTAFKATFGEGYPNLCVICEYDGAEDYGHITGHNLLCAISLLAAFGLKKAAEKIKGTITVLGCPGEYYGGAKVTMAKQGVFQNIDAVLMAHPDIETSESGTSFATTPLAVTYTGKDGLSFLNDGTSSALDGMLLTFNIINMVNKRFSKKLTIEGVLSNGGETPLLLPKEVTAKFYIRGETSSVAAYGEKELRDIINFVEKKLNLSSKIVLYSPPYQELLTNITLSRLFSHNLKECGIIEVKDFKTTRASLSLGAVSHKSPSIHPYIGILQEEGIAYGTKEFGAETLTAFAKERAEKAACALALTGLDLIESENLLSEVKDEFYHNTKI
ncbi:MAG: M20 family peptidase [Clostridiaceae bacterium]